MANPFFVGCKNPATESKKEALKLILPKDSEKAEDLSKNNDPKKFFTLILGEYTKYPTLKIVIQALKANELFKFKMITTKD